MTEAPVRRPATARDAGSLRAVSFDAAGTLFHPVRSIGELYAEVAARHDIRVAPEILHARFRRAFHAAPPLAFPELSTSERRARERGWWHAIVSEVFSGLAGERFEAYFDELFAFFATTAAWRVDPDARPLLQSLRARGLRILVVSNFDARVRDVLAALELAPLIDQITISSEAGAAKPDPRIFATALAEARCAPHEVLHVGDTAREDLAAAHAAGLRVLLVGGQELAAEAPDAPLVARLGDVEPWIDRV